MGLLSTFGSSAARAYGFTRSAIAAAVDQYFNLTTLLLPGNGTNGAQNNTFLDSSSNNFSITRNGNTTQGTFSPFSQSGWSGYFNGTTTSGPLVYASYSTTNFDWFTSGQDFTLECWVFPVDLATFSYLDGGQQVPRLTGNNDQNGLDNYWSFGPISDGTVRFHYFNGAVVRVTSTATVTANTWNHIAFTKTSSGITIFVNGTATTATAISGTPQSSATFPLTIGRGNSASINGYVSNYRILKNVTPPYSGTYTVPTAPLTNISGTKILTMQANRFVDSSSVANVMTVTGSTVSIQPFSPFAPTATYSATTNGGSAYFDGTGDYLTLATNQTALLLGSSDFTFEAWVYKTATGTNGILAGQADFATGAGSSYGFNLSSSTTSDLYVGSTAYTITSPNPPIGQWVHVAWARTGGTFSSYLNGSRVGTLSTLGTSSVNNGSTAYPPAIGSWGSGGNPLTGYISGLRLIKGSGGYNATSSTITIPTAPPTAITNTSLLLNFTNAGITDATAKNDLETVGNAQISTTQSKFGGSSMYFDGTGDGLLLRSSDIVAVGSGDFTMEAWINPSSQVNTFGTIFGSGASGGPVLTLRGSGTASSISMNPYGSADIFNYSYTFTTGAWYHIAVSRSGTSLRVFINGTQLSTTVTNSTNWGACTVIGGIDSGATQNYTGYIDDLRITKGYARYTASFTPPTAAFALQ